jgi:hypothetical protein
MKKETAVEWLVKELNKETGLTSFIADCDDEYKSTILSIIQQANEMFEQQIIDAITIGFDEGCSYMHNGTTKFETGLQYYNETYNNETTKI